MGRSSSFIGHRFIYRLSRLCRTSLRIRPRARALALRPLLGRCFQEAQEKIIAPLVAFLVAHRQEGSTIMPNSKIDVQGSKFPGFGICIYCNKKLEECNILHDEHVIPLSLNGDFVIEDANCTDCRNATHEADTHLAKSVFWRFRLHTDAKTRNPKERPLTLRNMIKKGDLSQEFIFPRNEAPYITAFPSWGKAGFFQSKSIDSFDYPNFHLKIYHWIPKNIRGTLNFGKNENLDFWFDANVDPFLFGRSIAKIAYCHMITRFGLYGFRRLALPDIILGKCPAIPYFIGDPFETPPPPYSSHAHHRPH